MAELLVRGFDAYWADRGNPIYDIACFSTNGRATRLRVKTTSDSEACWRARSSGSPFLEVRDPEDFVVVCDIKNGIRGASIYVVPTRVVEEHLARNHAEYCAAKSGRNKDAMIRVLRFFGGHRADNPSYGYHDKFAKYCEAWGLLK